MHLTQPGWCSCPAHSCTIHVVFLRLSSLRCTQPVNSSPTQHRHRSRKSNCTPPPASRVDPQPAEGRGVAWPVQNRAAHKFCALLQLLGMTKGCVQPKHPASHCKSTYGRSTCQLFTCVGCVSHTNAFKQCLTRQLATPIHTHRSAVVTCSPAESNELCVVRGMAHSHCQADCPKRLSRCLGSVQTPTHCVLATSTITHHRHCQSCA